MLVRSVSSGAVCLGCQLQILRQASYRPRSIPSASRVSAATRGRAPRWFTSESTAPSLETENGGHISRVSNQETQAKTNGPSLGPSEELSSAIEPQDRSFRNKRNKRESRIGTKRPLNLGKKYVVHNRVLKESSSMLEGDILGQPASVVVMRDGGMKKRKQPASEREKQENNEKSKNIHIESLIDNEHVPPSAAEVCANINELRPKDGIYLSAKEFVKLQQQLEDSFLWKQLSNYLETWKQERKKNPLRRHKEAAEEHGEYPWIRELEPWVPLATSNRSTEGIDHNLRGYVNPSASSKERFAIRIMRECWNLQIEELASGMGEIRVKLRSHEFVLLMRGSRRFLNVISHLFLDSDESIEASKSQKSFRIVTRRIKAQTILRELDRTLKNMKTRTIPWNLITPNPSEIDNGMLEELGRITNTFVTPSTTGKRAHVTWIGIPSYQARKLQVEDLAHVVFRLLYTAHTPEPARRRLYAPQELSGQLTHQFIVDTYNKEKWGWKDKLGQWARCVIPAGPKLNNMSPERESEKGLRIPPDAPFRLLSLPLGTPARASSEPRLTTLSGTEDEHGVPVLAPTESTTNLELQQPRKSLFPYHPVRWSPRYTTSTSVIFGHVLHSCQSMNLPSATELQNPHVSKPRIFSPIIPHPVQLAQLQQEPRYKSTLFEGSSIMLLRFVPARDNAAAPPLELRLSLSESPSTTEVTGVHSLRAITNKHIDDVLQPASPVDMRFTQTEYYELQGAPHHITTWQPIENYLSRARLELNDAKIEMPPNQRFPIPNRLFKMDNAEGETSVTYQYTGLELHRSVTIPYQSRTTLTYTSIEAGQSGGRRAEVSLQPIIEPADTDAPKEMSHHDEFLATCYDLARSGYLWFGSLGSHGIRRPLQDE